MHCLSLLHVVPRARARRPPRPQSALSACASAPRPCAAPRRGSPASSQPSPPPRDVLAGIASARQPYERFPQETQIRVVFRRYDPSASWKCAEVDADFLRRVLLSPNVCDCQSVLRATCMKECCVCSDTHVTNASLGQGSAVCAIGTQYLRKQGWTRWEVGYAPVDR